MFYSSQEFVRAIDLDRARWAAQDALVSEALVGQPKRNKHAWIGPVLVWLGKQFVFAGEWLNMRGTEVPRGRTPLEFRAEQTNS